VDTRVIPCIGRSTDCADGRDTASLPVSDKQPGRDHEDNEMILMSTTYTATALDDTADTVRLPRLTEDVLDRRPARPALDATRLWTGGLATAAVAALVALVGTLVVRVLFRIAPVGELVSHTVATADTGLLCLFAAVAALAATGIAHLLLVSTPNPLGYLGWIIGLATAAATVLPLLGGLPILAAAAAAVVNLVVGLAIGSLVVTTAATVHRPAAW
jgi:hypothetical protein